MSIIYFRVDSSDEIGGGHISRCLSLAKILRETNLVKFICREHVGNHIPLVESAGFYVHRLPYNSNFFVKKNKRDLYLNWLGENKTEDARQTSFILEKNHADKILIVDHYFIDDEWENFLLPYVSHTVVIDDLKNRPHICSLLVDQNISNYTDGGYLGLVQPDTKLLIGPHYALLSEEYRLLHEKNSIIDFYKTPLTIFVYFGSADHWNLTFQTIQALQGLICNLRVVIGENNPNKEIITRMAKTRGLTEIFNQQNSLASIMAGTQLAIGASGTTALERMCLGIPSVVITVAENQVDIAEKLERNELIFNIGHYTQFSAIKFRAFIEKLINNRDELENMSNRAKKYVDGKGTIRVASEIRSLK